MRLSRWSRQCVETLRNTPRHKVARSTSGSGNEGVLDAALLAFRLSLVPPEQSTDCSGPCWWEMRKLETKNVPVESQTSDQLPPRRSPATSTHGLLLIIAAGLLAAALFLEAAIGALGVGEQWATHAFAMASIFVGLAPLAAGFRKPALRGQLVVKISGLLGIVIAFLVGQTMWAAVLAFCLSAVVLFRRPRGARERPR